MMEYRTKGRLHAEMRYRNKVHVLSYVFSCILISCLGVQIQMWRNYFLNTLCTKPTGDAGNKLTSKHKVFHEQLIVNFICSMSTHWSIMISKTPSKCTKFIVGLKHVHVGCKTINFVHLVGVLLIINWLLLLAVKKVLLSFTTKVSQFSHTGPPSPSHKFTITRMHSAYYISALTFLNIYS